MKQSKQSQLIHIWEDYEFYLSIPKTFIGSNKPYVYFYYLNPKTNKTERIRKYLGKNEGNIKQIKLEAKKLILDLVSLLNEDWNPLTNEQNELTIDQNSSIEDCMNYWISRREESVINGSIAKKTLKNNKILISHFSSFLYNKSLRYVKPKSISHIQIKEFLDTKAFERNWGKVSYNTYLIDVKTFFNYLKDLKIIKENPCDRVVKKNIRNDSTRFKVFEKQELLEVSTLLSSDHHFFGLHIAAKFLFKYNIRPLELTRLQIRDVDLKAEILVIPYTKTKNGNEARFILDTEMIHLLRLLMGDHPNDWYIFGGRNKPAPTQVCSDYFGQNWRYFKSKYSLPNHLKMYALKHTSNYYDIQSGASYEEIRQRNRHSSLQVTTLYIKERLFKNQIKPSNSNLF
ncbi:MAG: hypothetical protein EOO90_17040 [Pedobacter sp.]|nr:MAG: hypothetical protein EOO90_17040 [Pedobacter sp.]